MTFGVSATIGLAPYLGKLDVPGFEPLLKLLPRSLQDTAIPLSSALMGVVSVIAQWHGATRLGEKRLQKWFRRTRLFAVLMFLALVTVYCFTVVRVPIGRHGDADRFLVGFSRPTTCPCERRLSDALCVERITLSEAAIASCWGDTRIRIAELCLLLSYLAFTSSFGALIGLVRLQAQRLGGASSERQQHPIGYAPPTNAVSPAGSPAPNAVDSVSDSSALQKSSEGDAK